MADPLDRLKAEMKAATPEIRADAKARALAEAQKIFAARQESERDARLRKESPQEPGRFSQGVKAMFMSLTSRGGMVATTALVAVGLFAFAPGMPNLFVPQEADDQDPIIEATVIAEKPAIAEEPVAESAVESRGHERLESEALLGTLSAEPAATPAAPAPASVRQKRQASNGADLSLDDVQASGAEYAPRSVTVTDEFYALGESDTEVYANEASNPLQVTQENPVSTFSIDVDTASYSVVRSWLNRGQMPPRNAVRVEELINYFPYDYAEPTGEMPFQPTVSVTQTPWNSGTQLVHIALQGEKPALADRPPLNLVFLIDTSGSMQDRDKLPLLKTAFRMMLGQLNPEDEVSIVTYAGSAGQVLEPTRAEDRATILAALDRLEAGGSTAGQAGLQQAYAVAEAMAKEGELNRVILATDGDFNVGLSDPEALKEFIAKKRETGSYLSVLGFGRGNLDDATMQALAQNGNGQAAYIDTASEARKVLVDQLSGALFPIANDVKIQVEFNPAAVAEYRLIGYETRALRREDFNNDAVDAGEIGAGHAVTAIYEVTPVGSPARRTDPLRYGTPPEGSSDELGFLRLRYKTPGESESQLSEVAIKAGVSEASAEVRFATAMAGFGQLLRGNTAMGSWSIGDAITLAQGARGEDAFGYRQEAVQLMRIAESLAE